MAMKLDKLNKIRSFQKMSILLDVSVRKQNAKKTIVNALRQVKFVVINAYALDAITMKCLC
jgi:hypothetical protein